MSNRHHPFDDPHGFPGVEAKPPVGDRNREPKQADPGHLLEHLLRETSQRFEGLRRKLPEELSVSFNDTLDLL